MQFQKKNAYKKRGNFEDGNFDVQKKKIAARIVGQKQGWRFPSDQKKNIFIIIALFH